MRKMILAAAAVASLAVPTAAMADAPNGNFDFKPTDQIAQVGKGNTVAKDSAVITQNGQFVSQQAQSGDRAAIVQGLLGH